MNIVRVFRDDIFSINKSSRLERFINRLWEHQKILLLIKGIIERLCGGGIGRRRQAQPTSRVSDGDLRMEIMQGANPCPQNML